MKSIFTGMFAAGVMSAASVVSLAIGSSASAADMPPAYKAPVAVAPPFTWTGFYIGGHVGYGWGETTVMPTGVLGVFFDSFRGKPDGFFGGGTVGYNYQQGNLVLGTEGEFSWSGVDTGNVANLVPLPGFTGTATFSNNWTGTLSTRLGVAFDTVLIYSKAGVAWANNDYSIVVPLAGYNSTISETDTGWLVGGGVEWAFARNWSAKIEGTYMDFGQKSHSFAAFPGGLPLSADIEAHVSTVKFGVNYRFY